MKCNLTLVLQAFHILGFLTSVLCDILHRRALPQRLFVSAREGTLEQVRAVADALNPATPAIVSVFAGRIADTGMDPIPHMLACKQILGSRPKAELLWASTRELLNIFHAEESGCDIITVPNEFLGKLDLVGKDLADYSRETVQLFYRDAAAAAYQIKTTRFAAE